jgi:hypothetical protein
MLGFKQVGIRSPSTVKMRFYSGDHDGQMNHHDIAPCENPNRPKPRGSLVKKDSPVEGRGFELSIPPKKGSRLEVA